MFFKTSSPIQVNKVPKNLLYWKKTKKKKKDIIIRDIWKRFEIAEEKEERMELE